MVAGLSLELVHLEHQVLGHEAFQGVIWRIKASVGVWRICLSNFQAESICGGVNLGSIGCYAVKNISEVEKRLKAVYMRVAIANY
jgi:hypothetical protein